MADTVLTVQTAVKVNGTTLSQRDLGMLTSLRVEVALNLVGRLTLRFDDAGFTLSTADVFKIGTQVEVFAPGSGAQIFVGRVSAVSLDHSAHHVPELVVTADEPTGVLARTGANLAVEKQSAHDVISRMLQECGLALKSTAQGLNTVQPYRLQLGTNLAYLDELVRAANAVWWFEPPRTVHVDPVGPVAPGPVRVTFPRAAEPGAEDRLLTFSVKAAHRQPQAAKVRAWDPRTQRTVVGETSTSTAAESAFVGSALSAEHKTMPIVTNGGGSHSQTDAKTLADALLTAARSDVVTAKGTALVDPRIRPGVQVEVADAGPSSGTYLVTRVEHVYDRRGFHTTFHTGSHRPRGLVDTLGAGNGQPGGRIDGVLIGIVTDLRDPANLGRIRVALPVLEDTPGPVQTDWARVATFDAGKGRGATFLPEIHDEVLVMFENGDVRRPVVIGALFSEKNRQPELGRLLSPNGGQVDTRRLTSRTGHTLEMVDQDGKGQVLLQHGKKKMQVKLDEQTQTVTIESRDGDIELTNGKAKVLLAKNGDITIDGVNVTVKGMKNVTVEAQGAATMKSTSGSTSVEGLTTTVKGTTTVTVQGGASAAIKGGTVAIN